ncbi:TPA: hypothetical protein ACGMMI_000674 [Streptococcus agalactiae]|nr:hypothetical protein [Streptococcus agalactiae]
MVLAPKSISLFYTAFSPCSVPIKNCQSQLGWLYEHQSHLGFLVPHNPSGNQEPYQLRCALSHQWKGQSPYNKRGNSLP